MKHPRTITVDGKVYDLNHIWPKNITIVLPATMVKPRLEINILVFFSNHCISREPKLGEAAHMNDHLGKPRVFCPLRYDLSHGLIRVLNNLVDKTCLYNRREGWIIAQYTNIEGVNYEYHIYFSLKKDRKRENSLVMRINSAHVKDNIEDNTPRFTNRRKRKKFVLIAREILA